MTNCHVCDHDRMLHDSWGCKMKCLCGLSIIYLTPNLYADPLDQMDQEAIGQANAVVAEAERLAESHIRELHERALAEWGRR